jgi:hypothetical protein
LIVRLNRSQLAEISGHLSDLIQKFSLVFKLTKQKQINRTDEREEENPGIDGKRNKETKKKIWIELV